MFLVWKYRFSRSKHVTDAGKVDIVQCHQKKERRFSKTSLEPKRGENELKLLFT